MDLKRGDVAIYHIDLDKEIFEVEVFVIVEMENIAVVWAVLASHWWNPWLSGKCDSLRKKPRLGLSPKTFVCCLGGPPEIVPQSQMGASKILGERILL